MYRDTLIDSPIGPHCWRMSQRLNSKGVQNKITDFYHLAADSRERDRLTKHIKETRVEQQNGQTEPRYSRSQRLRLGASRALVNNGKLFIATNELFMTADTAGRKSEGRKRSGRRRRKFHSWQGKEWKKWKKDSHVHIMSSFSGEVGL